MDVHFFVQKSTSLAHILRDTDISHTLPRCFFRIAVPGIRKETLGGRRKRLTSIKTKRRNRLNLEPALIDIII
jgi:hypothetical protein